MKKERQFWFACEQEKIVRGIGMQNARESADGLRNLCLPVLVKHLMRSHELAITSATSAHFRVTTT